MDLIDKNIDNVISTDSAKTCDDSLKENAEFAENAGLEGRITRKYDGVGLSGHRQCEWCLSRCGTDMTLEKAYEIGAFERHPGCGCVTEYIAKKGDTRRQNVWTKKWVDNKSDALIATEKEFHPADSIEEAKAFAQDRLGLDTSGYNWMNLNVANRINNEIDKVYVAFGDLHKAGVLDNLYVFPGKKDYVAAYNSQVNGMILKKESVAFKSSLGKLREEAIEQFTHGFWATPSEMHSIRHELGHAVEKSLSQKQLEKIEELRLKIYTQCGITEWSMEDTSAHMKAAANYVSYYGLRNTGEFIAECIAEVMDGSPRSTARTVAAIVKGR